MENYYHEPSLYARWTSSGRKLGGLQAQLVAQTTRLEVAETALREGGGEKSESFDEEDDPAQLAGLQAQLVAQTN